MISTSKQIYDKYNSSFINDKLICTKQDLEDYILYGIVVDNNGYYIDKNMNKISVEIIKPNSFNINLSGLVNYCTSICKEHKCNKIYCLSENDYNNLLAKGYIIVKNGVEYYRMFDKELWLVYRY